MLTNNVASVNIVRDIDRELEYIVTPNSQLVANQISNDFKKGTRSFNIIGSYGTGKSAFILAYQRSLAGKSDYFDVTLLQNPRLKFINIIGEYRSIKDVFAEYLEVETSNFTSQNIFSGIYNEYYDLGKKNPLLIISIDEFGKFLEYAFKHDPENELYFIQQLSEFVNNPDNNIILLTTVHQNFDAYSMNLNSVQKLEWSKVKGRFRELTFNEPVEQLLFLASEQLQGVYKSSEKRNVTESLSILLESKAFRFNEDQVKNIARNLYPLDTISAYVLTYALQRYGQNERSLFSFLQSTDSTSINEHLKKYSTFYSLANVYDYLIFNFYSFLQFYGNPDLHSWKSIKIALDLIEKKADKEISHYSSIIKAVGLLNLFSEQGSVLDFDFLVKYSRICLGISNAKDLIYDLEHKYRIIGYKNYSTRYVLVEGTDLDITYELLKASNKVDLVTDITTLLNRYYKLPPIIAKEATYKTGTPRLFEYIISEYPKTVIPNGETDGFINLIFNNSINIDSILKYSKDQQEAILYGFYKNSGAIRDLLFEIEKTRKVIEENSDDKVAVKELNEIMLHQQNLLNHKILNNFYAFGKEVIWVYGGKIVEISNKRAFNKLLSDICIEVYSKAPRFNNELINKQKLSGSIHTAKRIFLRALVNDWEKPDLGFAVDKYPPEKTIATALLDENGIKLYENVNGEITVTEKNKFHFIWNVSEEFLSSARVSKRKIIEFVNLLSLRPYKVKQGLIDFWIPTFLFIKRNDFALFSEDRYIPVLTPEVLELIIKNPEEFEIKTFDIVGVKLNLFNSYRSFLNQASEQKPGNTSFIETIKPFLVFYRGLSEYSKNTSRLSKEALLVREVIAKAKDPEQTFFDAFPTALGYSLNQLQENETNLQLYTNKLQDAVREIRSSYDELIVRIELFIAEEIIGEKLEFEGYKLNLQQRFQGLKKHLLLPRQKKFVQRLDSEIDDKKAWLNSITQAIIGTTLDRINDGDELSLYEQFKQMIIELDSLTVISKSGIAKEKGELLSLEISSFDTGLSKRIIRLPKSKDSEVDQIESDIRTILSLDSAVNLIALSRLLKELMQK